MLPLLRHLSRRLLAHERLRLLLMPPDEFRRLLSVIRLDSLPVAAGAGVFGRGLGALLIFLQVLALERRRFRIMLLLELPQLRGLGARGVLLLLGASTVELLQLHVVMIAQSFLLLAMLTRDRLAHRVLPFGMMLHRPGRIFLRPPVEVVPGVLVVEFALPFRVMLVGPRRIALMPPGVGVPNMFIVEVAPPVGVILARPVGLRRIPPTGRPPDFIVVERAPPFGMICACPVRIVLPPPSCRSPEVLSIEVAPPIRMILTDPVGAVRPPPSCGAPIMMLIEVAPPIGMMGGYPLRLQLPPPRRGIPQVVPDIAPPFRMILQYPFTPLL